MASPQFHHLIEQIHKVSQSRKLSWEPALTEYEQDLYFRIALGEGIVLIETSGDDELSLNAAYTITLLRRDGWEIDRYTARQCESELYPMLRDIYRKAREDAFDLNRLIDEMQNDLEAGRARDLPKPANRFHVRTNDDSVPF